MVENNPLSILQREYSIRRVRNPHYSIRSFARKLGIGSGPLSELLCGKRPLTKKMSARIAKNLVLESEPEFNPLSADAFSAIADWHYYALLSLMQTDDFVSSPRWIANRLGIPANEVRLAISRLK